MFRPQLWALLFAAFCLSGCGKTDTSQTTTAPAGEQTEQQSEIRYLVVSLAPEEDQFNQAAKILVKRHAAKQIHSDTKSLDSLLPEIRKLNPNYVAFIVRPDELDFNLVQDVLKLSTQVDDDPFVDFAYGYITGRDAQAAVSLVNASASTVHDTASITQFFVASDQLPRSMEQKIKWPLRKGSVPVTSFFSRGDKDEKRDEKFIAKSMKKLDDSPILLFESHGYPDGLVGGPKASDLAGRSFNGSVALNVACYTGVTSTWFEDDWSTGQVRERTVEPKDSFCLQMIDRGVAAYFAYACPRPSGPTMRGNSLLVASAGLTVGELQRQNLNSTVLAHLMAGSDSIEIKKVADGNKISTKRAPGQYVRRMSTGSMLIGDPAFRPFKKRDKEDPRTQSVTRDDNLIKVDLHVGTQTPHYYCGDQLNYWNDREPALRLEGAVSIGDEQDITNVRILESSLGEVAHKSVAAVETHAGQRMLRFKANFALPETSEIIKLERKGLGGKFELETSPNGGSPSSKIIRNQHGLDNPK